MRVIYHEDTEWVKKSELEKLREAAKDFIAGEITVGEFEAVIYGEENPWRAIAEKVDLNDNNVKVDNDIRAENVKPDNSLMDKVKVCPVCQYPGDNHYERCKAEVK